MTDGAGGNELARVEAIVRGRVQGVGFRYFAWREAQDLALEGWVANEPDGSLRCLAQGPRDRVEALLRRLEAWPGWRDRRACQCHLVAGIRPTWVVLGAERSPSRRLSDTPSAAAERDRRAIPTRTIGRARCETMEQNSPAEELPALYRAILDRVADLETGGDRAEAARVRATATRIYSRAWDESARRGLTALLRKTGPASGDPVPTRRGIRSRRVVPSGG